jgi:hypothetical protein
MFCNQQQRLHSGLPFFGVVLDLRQFRDVLRGVAQRAQRLAAGLDRVGEALIPRHYGLPLSRHGVVGNVIGGSVRVVPLSHKRGRPGAVCGVSQDEARFVLALPVDVR